MKPSRLYLSFPRPCGFSSYPFTNPTPPVPKQPSPENMGSLPPATDAVEVDGVDFPATTHAPGSGNTFFLAGAGVRGLELGGKFVKFTAIGVYLEAATSLRTLAGKWKGRVADELAEEVEFLGDVIRGGFEKFVRVTMILPLTGEQYAEKVTENCVAIWKKIGVYTDKEGEAAESFREAFKNRTFPPGSSILFTQSPTGTIKIAFSEDGTVPEKESAVIENRPMSEAVLASIIGIHGVSPDARRSLAERVAWMLDDFERENGDCKAEEKEIGGADGRKTELVVGNGREAEEMKETEETEKVESKCA